MGNIEKSRGMPETIRETKKEISSIEITFTPNELKEKRDKGELKDKQVVVIDVLRATSVIVTALFNGAKDVAVVASVEEARKLKEEIGEESLLCGERAGKLLAGFDLGNSPREYTPDKVKDRTIILTTSHGAQTIEAARGSKEIVIATNLNADAVRNYLMREGGEVVLAASGSKFQKPDGTIWEHRGGKEDVVLGCGLVLSGLIGQDTKLKQPWLRRLEEVSDKYIKGEKDIRTGLLESLWGQEMLRLDKEEGADYRQRDIEFIAEQTNRMPIVPVVDKDGRVRAKELYD